MRILTILSLLLLASPVFGELTKADLHDLKEDLHKVIKEEVAASEKRMKEYIDLKIETVNARIDALDHKVDVLDESLTARIDVTNTRIDYVDEGFDPFLVTVIVLVVSTLLLPIVIAVVYSKIM